jgi:hypothetical protein
MYLTVLQSTGAGAKFVTWVSEPILDHFWKFIYLAWLIGLWLGPAYLLGRAVTIGMEGTWLRLAIPLTVFWLAYPISQLSSLSGPTIWLPLHPDVLGRLAQKPGVVVGFLALSAGALAGLGLGFRLAFFTPGLHWLPIGSFIFVTCALIYARLLGRLAFVLAYTKSIFKRKKKKEEDESRKVFEPPKEMPEVTQPSELPPIKTFNDDLLTGYDLSDDDKPRKRVIAEVVQEDDPKLDPPPKRPSRKTGGTHVDKSRQWTDDDEDATPYGVGELEPIMQDEAAPSVVIKPTASEMKLLDRGDAPKRPKKAWTAEVWAFLGQSETIAAIGLLTVLCSIVGGMIRIARAFNPVAGES